LFTHLIHCAYAVSDKKRQILKKSGECVYSESLDNYVMVPRSVIRRECNPGYLGESIEGSAASSKGSVDVDPVVLGVKPEIAQTSGRSISYGSQSICSASVVSDIVPVVTQSIPVVSVSSELVSILKRVSSNSKISRSNAASPAEVVSDSSGCSVKVEKKCGKDRKAHRHSDKEVSAPSSASEGVTVETADKSVKFRLQKSKEKNKTNNSDESDSSESE